MHKHFKQARLDIYTAFKTGFFAPYGLAGIEYDSNRERLVLNVLPSALSLPTREDMHYMSHVIRQNTTAPIKINLLHSLEDYCRKYQNKSAARTTSTAAEFLENAEAYLLGQDPSKVYKDVEVMKCGQIATRLDLVQPKADERSVLAQIQVVDPEFIERDSYRRHETFTRRRSTILDRGNAVLGQHYGLFKKMHIKGHHDGANWKVYADLDAHMLAASFK